MDGIHLGAPSDGGVCVWGGGGLGGGFWGGVSKFIPPPPPQKAGANINATDKLRRTPLMEAVANNHVEAARYMLRRGGCVYSKVGGGLQCLYVCVPPPPS